MGGQASVRNALLRQIGLPIIVMSRLPFVFGWSVLWLAAAAAQDDSSLVQAQVKGNSSCCEPISMAILIGTWAAKTWMINFIQRNSPTEHMKNAVLCQLGLSLWRRSMDNLLKAGADDTCARTEQMIGFTIQETVFDGQVFKDIAGDPARESWTGLLFEGAGPLLNGWREQFEHAKAGYSFVSCMDAETSKYRHLDQNIKENESKMMTKCVRNLFEHMWATFRFTYCEGGNGWWAKTAWLKKITPELDTVSNTLKTAVKNVGEWNEEAYANPNIDVNHW